MSTEHAISLIVAGFCKEVFKELPMEFALEAQQLLGISLEGSVDDPMLDIQQLRASVADIEILKGILLAVAPGEVHAIMGPTAPANPPRAGDRGHPGNEGHWRRCDLRGAESPRRRTDIRAQKGSSLPFSTRRDSRRDERVLHALGVHELRKARREQEIDPMDFSTSCPRAQAGRDGSRHDAPRRQLWIFRRREEAQRDSADGGARAQNSPFSTKPIRASTSMRSASRGWRE